ncbi:MAG: hypothetical protein D3924_07025 [Candidatus Electrothrix sp. AR4]|nr:hypothetical protein [Candidatus Electrothrix sp. AR4]
MQTKFNKKTAAGILALLIAVSFIPAVAGACPRRQNQGINCDMTGKGCDIKGQRRSFLSIWQNQTMIDTLGLTQEQIKKIQKADYDAREKHLGLRAELADLNLKMDRAFSADVVDDKAVMALTKKKADAKEKMMLQRSESRLMINKLLTPEQNKKLQLAKMSRKGGALCPKQGGGRGNGRRNNR